jgi:hypothetical protein
MMARVLVIVGLAVGVGSGPAAAGPLTIAVHDYAEGQTPPRPRTVAATRPERAFSGAFTPAPRNDHRGAA